MAEMTDAVHYCAAHANLAAVHAAALDLVLVQVVPLETPPESWRLCHVSGPGLGCRAPVQFRAERRLYTAEEQEARLAEPLGSVDAQFLQEFAWRRIRREWDITPGHEADVRRLRLLAQRLARCVAEQQPRAPEAISKPAHPSGEGPRTG